MQTRQVITNHSPRGQEIEKSQIKDFIKSKDPFPIDFDEAWEWCGYARKDPAKRKLVANFIKDFDYKILNFAPHKSGAIDKQSDSFAFHKREAKIGKRGGHNKEVIKLSSKCFKYFAMLAETERGKKIREYYLNCESELYELKQRIIQEAEQKLLDSEKKVKQLENKQKFNDSDFYTIYQFCKMNGLFVSSTLMKIYSERCIEMSKKMDKPIYSFYHEKYNQVRVYHLDILRAIIK